MKSLQEHLNEGLLNESSNDNYILSLKLRNMQLADEIANMEPEFKRWKMDAKIKKVSDLSDDIISVFKKHKIPISYTLQQYFEKEHMNMFTEARLDAGFYKKFIESGAYKEIDKFINDNKISITNPNNKIDVTLYKLFLKDNLSDENLNKLSIIQNKYKGIVNIYYDNSNKPQIIVMKSL